MRPCRLQEVSQLDFPHQDEVALEDFIDSRAQVRLIVDAKLEQAEKERDEIQFVARSVVNPIVATERLLPVYLDLGDSIREASL